MVHGEIFENGKQVEGIDLLKMEKDGTFVIQGKTFSDGKTKNIYLTNRKKNKTFRVPKKRVEFKETKERQSTPSPYRAYSLRKRLSRKQRNKKSR